eukprot:6173399-Pleurochrysis_carterae.AAC.2
MEWWDDLWLNEGFATWMETGVCHKLHPVRTAGVRARAYVRVRVRVRVRVQTLVCAAELQHR